MKPEVDDLRHLLREWRDLPACDPRLAANVVDEIYPPAFQRRVGTGRGLSLRLALAGIAAGATAGVAVVEWRAQRVETLEMPQRYLAWIDPLPAPGAQP